MASGHIRSQAGGQALILPEFFYFFIFVKDGNYGCRRKKTPRRN
jgi:hypothetical protein